MEKIIKILLEALRAFLKALSAPKPVSPPKTPKAPQRSSQGVSDVSLIKKWEGLRLKAYLCPANVWTIGYGHTKGVHPDMVITTQTADELLREDLRWVEDTINESVKVELTQNQYDALASFIYNVGAGAFKKSTMLRKLNDMDYHGASKEFPRWNKGGGVVLQGLVKRRQEEQELFRKD